MTNAIDLQTTQESYLRAIKIALEHPTAENLACALAALERIEGMQRDLTERLISAEHLITDACCFSLKEMGRKLRDSFIDNFKRKLSEHEKRFTQPLPEPPRAAVLSAVKKIGG